MPKFNKFYLDNIATEDVANKAELNINLDFSKEAQQTITITDFEFVRGANDLIIDKVTNPNTSNTGITEGLPFRIDTQNGVNIFDGYLDLQAENKYNEVFDYGVASTVKAVDKRSTDWLNSVADGISPEYLYSIGSISVADCVAVPYVINSIPNYKDAAIMMISVYTITASLIEKITEVTFFVSKLTNPFEATAIVRMISYVVYLTTYLISLVKLIKQLINVLIQPVKYHFGMFTNVVLQRCAEHFGLNFRCSALELGGELYGDFILPEKFDVPVNEDKDGIQGWLTNSKLHREFVPRSTFGDLIRELQKKINGKIKIVGNDIFLLKQGEQLPNTPQWTMPPYKSEAFKLNTQDLKSNWYIRFETDLSEANTVDQYLGTSYQVVTYPNIISNPDLKLLKGFEEIRIGYALAKTKKELTIPEKIVKVFLDSFDLIMNGLITVVNVAIAAANAIAKVINKIIKALGVIGIDVNWEIKPIKPLKKVNLSEIIENRIGMLILEKDFFNVPKNFILTVNAEDKKNKPNEKMTAKYLYDNFYFDTDFVRNQFFIRNLDGVPLTEIELNIIRENNEIILANGNNAEVRTLSWNAHNETANLEYWEKKIYNTNLLQKFIETNGE